MEFRWNAWNLEHATKHGVSPEEAESVVRRAGRGYPRQVGDEKLLVVGRGTGDRFACGLFARRRWNGLCHPRDAAEPPQAGPATREVVRNMAKNKLKNQSGYARFMALSDAEKERVWESFKREIPWSETKPLSAKMRREWQRAIGRGPGRPRAGEGAKPVYVTIERGLLRRADSYAKAQGMTRAQLVAKGLALVLPPDRGTRRKTA